MFRESGASAASQQYRPERRAAGSGAAGINGVISRTILCVERPSCRRLGLRRRQGAACRWRAMASRVGSGRPVVAQW